MPEQSSGPNLEGRLRALELEVNDLRRGRRAAGTAPRPSRAHRIIASVSVILAIGLLPMVAFASDTFTDVPDSSQFHDAINNLSNAGITRGCGGTLFCPQDPVKRQQMAAFLNRGLGRATGAQGSQGVTADSTVTLAGITVETGGLTGGTGFVLVTGSLTAFTLDGATCPCTVSLRLRDTTAGVEPGLFQFITVANTTTPFAGGAYRFGTGTMSWVFSVPSGTSESFVIRAGVDMTGATGTLTLQGHLTALYVPFGSTGGSTLGDTGDAPSTDGLGD